MLPPLGSRVSLRYRLPEGEVPPHTDVVGHVERADATVGVRTRHGDLVEVAADDVLAVRVIPEMPVRTSQIRNLEHAAALAWPGTEHVWLDGWFLRFGDGQTRRANSAVPVEAWASPATVPAIVDWYGARGVTPLLAAPDRLLRLRPDVPVDGANAVLVADVAPGPPAASVVITDAPDENWRSVDPRAVPDEVLTAVVDGVVAFATIEGVAAARGAVTSAPDGTRWVGLSAVHVVESARRGGHGRAICDALLAWGAGHGATRAYVQVLDDNAAALRLYAAMGFRTQHGSRYVDARRL